MSRNEKLGNCRKIPLIILVVFLFCCSCGPGKHLPVQTENRDSVRVEVREKTVYIHDTVLMEIPAQSAENTTRDTSSHLETDYAESDARIDPDGMLHHSLKNKPQKHPVPVDVPQTQKDSIVYRDRYISETVEVPRELTAWQKWQMRSFWILLSGLVVFVIRKPLLTLIPYLRVCKFFLSTTFWRNITRSKLFIIGYINNCLRFFRPRAPYCNIWFNFRPPLNKLRLPLRYNGFRTYNENTFKSFKSTPLDTFESFTVARFISI